MINLHIKKIPLALLAVTLATIGFSAPPAPQPPTPEEALDYAKSVVWVKRVVEGGKIHSYVKEIWRFDAKAGTPPAVGSEFGIAMPYNSMMKFPERDGIVFNFGSDRPKGLPMGWGIQVAESGMVFPFHMNVDSVRSAVKSTDPKG